MRILKALAPAAAIIFSPSIAYPQDESCNGVLELAGKDVTISSRNLTTAEYAYNAVCSGTTVKSGVDVNGSIGVVIDALPIDLSGGGSTRNEKATHMCSTFTQWRMLNFASSDFSSTAVRDAIKAWQTCKEMSKKSVYINVEPGVELLKISLKRGTENAEFRGITIGSAGPTGGVACQFRQQIGSTFTDTDATGTAGLPYPMNDGSELIVACKRPSQADTSGAQYFESTEVIVNTSRGGILLPWYRDVKYGPTYGSQLAQELASIKADYVAKVAQLKADQANTAAQAATLRNDLNKIGTAGADRQSATNLANPGGQPDRRHSAGCPDGSYATGIEARAIIGNTFSEVGLYCRPFRP